MRFVAAIGIQTWLFACVTGSAIAQHQGAYARIASGISYLDVPLGDFPLRRVIEPSLTLGFVVRTDHALQLSLGYVRAETTETWQGPSAGEAPFSVAIRAMPLTVAYRYNLPWQAGPIRPLVSVGGVWSRVVDGMESDTPREEYRSQLYGWTAAFGLTADLGGPFAAVVRGGYRHTQGTPDRHSRAIGLSGVIVDAGLELSF